MMSINFMTFIDTTAPRVVDGKLEQAVVGTHRYSMVSRLPLMPIKEMKVKFGPPGTPDDDLAVYEIDAVALNLSTHEIDVGLQGIEIEAQEKDSFAEEQAALEKLGFKLHSYEEADLDEAIV